MYLIRKNVVILSIDCDGALLKSAYIESIKKQTQSSKGKSIIGKLLEEPIIEYPNNYQIQEIYNRSIKNSLQLSGKLSAVQINESKNDVFNKLKNEKINRNWPLISLTQNMLIPNKTNKY